MNKNNTGAQLPRSSAVQIFAMPIRRKVGGGAKAGYFRQIILNRESWKAAPAEP